MKEIACILLLGFIIIFWYLVNVFNKPVLNKMKNFYEEDEESKSMANMLIGLMLILACTIGALMF